MDEARLTGKRLSTALNVLAQALDESLGRAHIVITSRVTDWRPGEDLALVASTLRPATFATPAPVGAARPALKPAYCPIIGYLAE